jgi:hypothetical protein
LLNKEVILFHLARLYQEADNQTKYREYSRLLTETYPDGTYAQMLTAKRETTSAKLRSAMPEAAGEK